MSDSRPIGVFDSGVGGISVLKELQKKMPHENFIYFGDSANAPYGTKPFGQVEELTCHTAQYLVNQGVKALVIACNTATAAAVHIVRAQYPDMPVIGIEPALKPAVEHNPGGLVVVLATNVTLAEPKFLKLMQTYKDRARIRTIGCPDIVTHVESGDLSSPALKHYLEERLRFAIHDVPDAKLSDIDAVVLGCTHYPFVRPLLQSILRADCLIIDGGDGTARETARQLKIRGLLSDAQTDGNISILNSDPAKIALATTLFHTTT